MVKKIEFLNRLFKLAACLEELIDFLRSEKLLTDHQLGTVKSESDKAKYLYGILEDLKQQDRLLLLDYEWQILPIERLKLVLVTDRVSKEFRFNS